MQYPISIGKTFKKWIAFDNMNNGFPIHVIKQKFITKSEMPVSRKFYSATHFHKTCKTFFCATYSDILNSARESDVLLLKNMCLYVEIT